MTIESDSTPSKEEQVKEIESALATHRGEEILLIRIARQVLSKFDGKTGSQVLGFVAEHYYGRIGYKGYTLRRKESLSPAVLNFENSDIPLPQSGVEIFIGNDAVNKWENQEPENAMLYKELKRTFNEGAAVKTGS